MTRMTRHSAAHPHQVVMCGDHLHDCPELSAQVQYLEESLDDSNKSFAFANETIGKLEEENERLRADYDALLADWQERK